MIVLMEDRFKNMAMKIAMKMTTTKHELGGMKKYFLHAHSVLLGNILWGEKTKYLPPTK